MKIQKLGLQTALTIEPTVFKDFRGHFFESFKLNELTDALGHDIRFVQENQSFSHKNVFRGFHFQTGDFAQAKLVRVLKGSVIDIIVDLQTFETAAIHLSEENMVQLFVPRNFAHGFYVLEDAVFDYKCDNYYSKEHEGGIHPHEILRSIESPINMDLSRMICHEKDLAWPKLSELRNIVKFNNEEQSR